MASDTTSGAREAARCYRLYRPPLPKAMLDDLLAHAGAAPGDRLLDLACGPGRVALALAPAFAAVTAVDLSDAMVAEGKIAAAECGIANVTWQSARAEDAEATSGAYHLVTIGDALQRLDQDAILERSRRWLVPGGTVAILRSLDTLSGAEPWHGAVRDAVARWSGRDAAGLAAPTPPPTHNEALLTAHGFRDVASFAFEVPYDWTVEAILGNLFSTSYCARHALGTRSDAFADAVTRAIAPYAVDGIVRETLTFGYTFGRT